MYRIDCIRANLLNILPWKFRKIGFYYLNKRVDNNYILNNEEYPRTATVVKSLILNFQPKYNSNSKYQYQGFSNPLMFALRGKTEYDEGETKEDIQNPK